MVDHLMKGFKKGAAALCNTSTVHFDCMSFSLTFHHARRRDLYLDSPKVREFYELACTYQERKSPSKKEDQEKEHLLEVLDYNSDDNCDEHSGRSNATNATSLTGCSSLCSVNTTKLAIDYKQVTVDNANLKELIQNQEAQIAKM